MDHPLQNPIHTSNSWSMVFPSDLPTEKKRFHWVSCPWFFLSNPEWGKFGKIRQTQKYSNRNEEQLHIGQKFTNPTWHGGVKNNRNMFFLKVVVNDDLKFKLSSGAIQSAASFKLLWKLVRSHSRAVFSRLFFVGCPVVERDHMDPLSGWTQR